MLNAIISILSAAIAIGAVYGLVFWANKAQTDRSAIVGIYLLFGLPGGLLTVAGLALVTNQQEGGPLIMGLGLAFSLPLFKPFRRLLARFTPLDPDSPIDLSGLAMLLAVGTFLVIQATLSGPADVSSDGETALTENVAWLILNVAMFVLIAYACVGYRIHRNGVEATNRLGLHWPDLKTIAISAALVVPCFLVSITGSVLTVWLQPDVVDNLEQTMDQMTTGLDNPLGALFIGLSAGVGEEVLFRGAIQPRFGIVLAALFWTALHVQYDISFVLLGLFGVGVIFGLQRRYLGTASAIITHALYNMVVVAIQMAS